MSILSVVDFRTAKTGMLVKRSDHWLTDRGRADAEQIGILVDKNFYLDANGVSICWPVIHWELQPMSSSCHPVNVTPYRSHELKLIQMSE